MILRAAVLALVFALPLSAGETPITPELAATALRQSAEFFRTKVASHGGYVYQYSEDLTRREGEGQTGAETVWVQPPGTPAVGRAFLNAYDATGDTYYLDGAKEACNALIQGQLRSGGWTYPIHFNSDDRKKFAYRVDPPRERAKNVSTLDDNTTASAITLLIRADKALEFKDAAIHEAATVALDSLMKAQFPNGAWPQGFSEPPDPAKFPVIKPSIPEDWHTLPRIKEYWNYYTLNDNVMANTIGALLEAWRVYDDKKYLESAEKAGEFLILAQLPAPQAGWAQQYDVQMQPCWARKFEPPAVSGGETQGVIRILIRMYEATGKPRYLEPIPAALSWLRASRLPDGQLARFNELKTNKPLYFTKDYQVTYDDSDMPTHYGFKVTNTVDELAAAYEKAKATPPTAEPAPKQHRMSDGLQREAQRALNALDDKGRWVEDGELKYVKPKYAGKIIRSETFIKYVEALSRYIAASK